MANAAQSFDDIARCMADGEERHHLEFLAAECRRCEEARKALESRECEGRCLIVN